MRLGDKKSLVLVDASNKTYVQELKEIAEPDDAKPESREQAEAPDIPTEKFERNLESFSEAETAEYERQKQFHVCEDGVPGEMEGEENKIKRETWLGDYSNHGVEHIREVMNECNRYISSLEKAGIKVPEFLRRSCGVAAKYHDIGMGDGAGMELSMGLAEKLKQSGGDFSKLAEYYHLDLNFTKENVEAKKKELVEDTKGDSEKIKAIMKVSRMQELILEAAKEAEELRSMSPDDPERAETEKAYRRLLSEMQDGLHRDMRNHHARKSAEYVLAHSDECRERYGKDVNPRNVVACAIMLRTKSNSGCGDLNVLAAGEASGENLSVEEACSHLIADWNLNHDGQRAETVFSDADLKEIAFMASVLRPADNRRDGMTATFTSGDEVLCETFSDGVEVFHGEKKNGVLEKKQPVRTSTSKTIIAAESCTQFGEIRLEGDDMVRVMRFNGLKSAALEQLFAENALWITWARSKAVCSRQTVKWSMA